MANSIKDLIIQLEDEGVIVWDSNFKIYVYKNDPGKAFNLAEYMKNNTINKYSR